MSIIDGGEAETEFVDPEPISTSMCLPETDWGCVSEAWVEGLDPEVKARSEALAWTALQALTGYRLSLCPIVIRPCSAGCLVAARTWYAAPVHADGFGAGAFRPHINAAGVWVNGCGCSSDCSCSRLSEVILPRLAGRIIEVTIDGVPLPSSAYRVDNGVRLVRLDGDTWPLCQDMTADVDEVGSFTVKYADGLIPDMVASYAAGLLAEQFALACTGKKCQLPAGVTTISRQGVTMEIQTGMFPGGYTGIRGVDTYLYTVNPHGLKTPSKVISIDEPTPRMGTWYG